jgi:hypothetical protein
MKDYTVAVGPRRRPFRTYAGGSNLRLPLPSRVGRIRASFLECIRGEHQVSRKAGPSER